MGEVPLKIPNCNRYSVESEEMVATGIKANTCISVMSTVEYDSGREYFEVRITQMLFRTFN